MYRFSYIYLTKIIEFLSFYISLFNFLFGFSVIIFSVKDPKLHVTQLKVYIHINICTEQMIFELNQYACLSLTVQDVRNAFLQRLRNVSSSPELCRRPISAFCLILQLSNRIFGCQHNWTGKEREFIQQCHQYQLYFFLKQARFYFTLIFTGAILTDIFNTSSSYKK